MESPLLKLLDQRMIATREIARDHDFQRLDSRAFG